MNSKKRDTSGKYRTQGQGPATSVLDSKARAQTTPYMHKEYQEVIFPACCCGIVSWLDGSTAAGIVYPSWFVAIGRTQKAAGLRFCFFGSVAAEPDASGNSQRGPFCRYRRNKPSTGTFCRCVLPPPCLVCTPLPGTL